MKTYESLHRLHRLGNSSAQESVELYPRGAVVAVYDGVMQALSESRVRRDADATCQGTFVAKPQTAHATAPLGFLPVSFMRQDLETVQSVKRMDEKNRLVEKTVFDLS